MKSIPAIVAYFGVAYGQAAAVSQIPDGQIQVPPSTHQPVPSPPPLSNTICPTIPYFPNTTTAKPPTYVPPYTTKLVPPKNESSTVITITICRPTKSGAPTYPAITFPTITPPCATGGTSVVTVTSCPYTNTIVPPPTYPNTSVPAVPPPPPSSPAQPLPPPGATVSVPPVPSSTPLTPTVPSPTPPASPPSSPSPIPPASPSEVTTPTSLQPVTPPGTAPPGSPPPSAPASLPGPGPPATCPVCPPASTVYVTVTGGDSGQRTPTSSTLDSTAPLSRSSAGTRSFYNGGVVQSLLILGLMVVVILA